MEGSVRAERRLSGKDYPYVPSRKSEQRQWRCVRRKKQRSVQSSLQDLSAQSASQLPRLAIFASGRGSNLKAISKAIEESRLRATIVVGKALLFASRKDRFLTPLKQLVFLQVLVSDSLSCGATLYARSTGLPVITYPDCSGVSGSERTLSAAALQLLLAETYGVDYVVLAGYLKVDFTGRLAREPLLDPTLRQK